MNTLANCLVVLLAGTIGYAGETSKILPAERDDRGFLVHRVTSPLQAGPTTIRVLLPEPSEPGRRYPVLYVLPVESGNGDRYGDGLAECNSGDLHNKHGLICVAPTFSELPWYADHPTDPRIQQEAYLLRTVIPWVDRNYPTVATREGRLLVGFSKSGWGAFSLLLRHPETFGKAAAWDAPLMKEKPDQFGMGPIFGTQENFERYQVSRLLEKRASQFRSEPRLIHLGYGNFRNHHQEVETLMRKLAIAHDYRDGPAREHTWGSGWLPEAVEMLAGSNKRGPDARRPPRARANPAVEECLFDSADQPHGKIVPKALKRNKLPT